MRYFSLTFLSLTLFFSLPLFGAAAVQTLGGNVGGTNLNTTITPPNPGANQSVRIDIESFATDLDRADITWSVNGKLGQSGLGSKSFTFKTGALGSVSNVSVVIKTINGEVIQKDINIRPASVSLIWEAQSYTPPFYKGKAMFPFQGTVKVIAIPNIINELGGRVGDNNLVYTWSVDGDNVSNYSGYGKNYMLFTGSIPINSRKIGVEVSTVDKKYTASQSIELSPQGVENVVYEDDPLLGILYNKAIVGNYSLKNQEVKLVGIPYFIGSSKRNDSGLVYEWRQNQSLVNKGENSDLTLKLSDQSSGSSFIDLQISNPNKIFQLANEDFSISYNKQSAGNLFPTQ